MTALLLPVLEWSLTLTGLVAFFLASTCWLQGWDELVALRAARLNGALLAAAKHHVWRSTFRALPAMISVVCGIWLLLLPDDTDKTSIMAKACWLFYQVAMISNLFVERWSRAQVRG